MVAEKLDVAVKGYAQPVIVRICDIGGKLTQCLRSTAKKATADVMQKRI